MRKKNNFNLKETQETENKPVVIRGERGQRRSKIGELEGLGGMNYHV